jgi:hypothetical protein
LNAPAKGLLKTVSILFIVFGAIFTIFALLSLWGMSMLKTGGMGAVPGVDMSMFNSKGLMASQILLLAGSILDIVFGIIGLKKCGDPEKEGFFFYAGVILCALSVIALYLDIITAGFGVTGLIRFILPILFIVGSVIHKKALAAQQQT